MRKWFSLLILFLSGVHPALVNATDLVVKVIDEGDPVYMAEVFVIDSNSRMILNTKFTDQDGTYRYSITPGLYEILVTKEEFSSVRITTLEVKGATVEKVVEIIPSAFAEDSEGESLHTDSGGCD